MSFFVHLEYFSYCKFLLAYFLGWLYCQSLFLSTCICLIIVTCRSGSFQGKIHNVALTIFAYILCDIDTRKIDGQGVT
jgi:hypothetical protein